MIGEVVSGSPADGAGLKTGDVIQAVDGTAIDSAQALVDMMKGYAPGDEVTLTVLSGDQTSDVKVTLAERPSDVGSSTEPYNYNFPMGPHTGILAMLGVDTTVTDNGLQINSIADNSPLADSGLQAGDVITKINGDPVLEGRQGMMFQFQPDQPVVFTVVRDGKEMDIDVTIDWSNAIQIMPMQPGQGQPGQPGQPGFNYGQQPPSQLGVQFRTLTPDLAKQDNLPVEQGAQIVQVFDNTPAAQAGLQADDIITAVDGDAVDEEHTLADRLVAYEEGDTVTLTVNCAGEEMSVDVVLGPRASNPMGGMFWGEQGQSPYWGGHMGPNGGMFWFHHGNPTNPDEVPTPEATPGGTGA